MYLWISKQKWTLYEKFNSKNNEMMCKKYPVLYTYCLVGWNLAAISQFFVLHIGLDILELRALVLARHSYCNIEKYKKKHSVQENTLWKENY